MGPLCHVKMAIYEASSNKIPKLLIKYFNLGLSASGTVRNKYLLFKHLVYGIEEPKLLHFINRKTHFCFKPPFCKVPGKEPLEIP